MVRKPKALSKPKDDTKARKARANRLMKEVEQLLAGEKPKSPSVVVTPRAFIHRRMQELREQQRHGGKE